LVVLTGQKMTFARIGPLPATVVSPTPKEKTTMKNNKGEKFTTSPYRLWALLSTVVLLASAAGFGYDCANGIAWQTALVERALAAGIATLVAFWLSWATSLLSPVWLSEKGIRSYTPSGYYRLVKWEEIAAIDAITIPGFHYARVTPRGGKAIWIPVWLIEKDHFLATAKEHGLVGNALERAFDGSVKHHRLVTASPMEHSQHDVICHPHPAR
jgi:hypothetical protein